MMSFALILMTLPSRLAEARARRAVLSAKGAGSFPAWGSAPGNRVHESTRADSAIHFHAMPGVRQPQHRGQRPRLQKSEEGGALNLWQR
jgi:hypothetical protein